MATATLPDGGNGPFSSASIWSCVKEVRFLCSFLFSWSLICVSSESSPGEPAGPLFSPSDCGHSEPKSRDLRTRGGERPAQQFLSPAPNTPDGARPGSAPAPPSSLRTQRGVGKVNGVKATDKRSSKVSTGGSRGAKACGVEAGGVEAGGVRGASRWEFDSRFPPVELVALVVRA